MGQILWSDIYMYLCVYIYMNVPFYVHIPIYVIKWVYVNCAHMIIHHWLLGKVLGSCGGMQRFLIMGWKIPACDLRLVTLCDWHVTQQ